MKKFVALVLALVLSLSLVTALAEDVNEIRYLTLHTVFEQLWEMQVYPAGLLSVNVMFTEANSVLLNVDVDSTRVDFHILQPGEWVLSMTDGILIREDVIEKLVADPAVHS